MKNVFLRAAIITYQSFEKNRIVEQDADFSIFVRAMDPWAVITKVELGGSSEVVWHLKLKVSSQSGEKKLSAKGEKKKNTNWNEAEDAAFLLLSDLLRIACAVRYGK